MYNDTLMNDTIIEVSMNHKLPSNYINRNDK